MKDNFNRISMSAGTKLDASIKGNNFLNTALDCLKNQGFEQITCEKAADGYLIFFERKSDGSQAALGYSYVNPRSSLIGLKIKGQPSLERPLADFIKSSLAIRLEGFIQTEEAKYKETLKKPSKNKKNSPNA